MISRSQIKEQIKANKFNRCDVCGKTAHDLHEIFYRNMTAKDSKAREASYAKELCALLCKSCHDCANNNLWHDALLQLNYWEYGVENVRSAYQVLSDTIKIPLRALPEVDTNVLQIRLKLLKDK